MDLDNDELRATRERGKTAVEMSEEYKELIWERDYYKLRFKELNRQWNRVINKLLGKNYYNYGCDWKTCDKFTADDLIYKYKKKWWQFWKKI